MQEMEATVAVVDGNGTETGHIIVTTIGGRNGQPKQVKYLLYFSLQTMRTTNVLLFQIFLL